MQQEEPLRPCLRDLEYARDIRMARTRELESETLPGDLDDLTPAAHIRENGDE